MSTESPPHSSGMATSDFLQFCRGHAEQLRAEKKELEARVQKLADDIAAIREARHAAQASIANVVDEMRVEHHTLEQQVGTLAKSISELVTALQGAYGSVGLVQQITALNGDVAALKAAKLAAENQVKGAKTMWMIVCSSLGGFAGILGMKLLKLLGITT